MSREERRAPVEGIARRLEFTKRLTVETREGVRKTKGAYPGERVLLEPGRKGTARLLEILASPFAPFTTCSVQDRCGGCFFARLSPEDEHKLKDAELARLFAPFGDIYEGLRTAPVRIAYRNKMEYTFGDEERGGPLRLGLHRRGMHHDIVEGPDCAIVHPDMERIRSATAAFFRDRGIAQYNRFRHEGTLRHLVVRRSASEGTLLANLVTTTQAPMDWLGEWAEVIRSAGCEGEVRSIWHTANDSTSDAIVAEGRTLIYGEPQLHEKVLGVRFPIGPFSFFQTNTAAAEALYAYVRELVRGAQEIWDLYAGTATIGAILSKEVGHVTSVELSPENVADARKMLLENDLQNIRVVQDDCKRFVRENAPPEVIVIDPPRAGIHPKVAQTLDLSGASKIIYVSCNPVTMAHDIHAMPNYRPESILCFDNFPRTLHVETVCLMTRVK